MIQSLDTDVFLASIYVATRTDSDLDEVKDWIRGKPGFTLDSIPGGIDQYMTVREAVEHFKS